MRRRRGWRISSSSNNKKREAKVTFQLLIFFCLKDNFSQCDARARHTKYRVKKKLSVARPRNSERETERKKKELNKLNKQK